MNRARRAQTLKTSKYQKYGQSDKSNEGFKSYRHPEHNRCPENKLGGYGKTKYTKKQGTTTIQDWILKTENILYKTKASVINELKPVATKLKCMKRTSGRSPYIAKAQLAQLGQLKANIQ